MSLHTTPITHILFGIPLKTEKLSIKHIQQHDLHLQTYVSQLYKHVKDLSAL